MSLSFFSFFSLFFLYFFLLYCFSFLSLIPFLSASPFLASAKAMTAPPPHLCLSTARTPLLPSPTASPPIASLRRCQYVLAPSSFTSKRHPYLRRHEQEAFVASPCAQRTKPAKLQFLAPICSSAPLCTNSGLCHTELFVLFTFGWLGHDVCSVTIRDRLNERLELMPTCLAANLYLA